MKDKCSKTDGPFSLRGLNGGLCPRHQAWLLRE